MFQVEGFCLGGLTVTFYPLLIEYIGAGARNLANVVAQCGYELINQERIMTSSIKLKRLKILHKCKVEPARNHADLNF
jgi:hypothetical protein